MAVLDHTNINMLPCCQSFFSPSNIQCCWCSILFKSYSLVHSINVLLFVFVYIIVLLLHWHSFVSAPSPPPSLSLTVCLSLPLLQFIQIACFRVCVHFHSNYPKIKHSKKYSPYMDERIYISCCYIIVTESYSYLTYLECLHYCWYFYYSVIIQLNYLFSSYLKLYDLGIEDNLCDNILLCLFIRSTHKQILFTFVSFS